MWILAIVVDQDFGGHAAGCQEDMLASETVMMKGVRGRATAQDWDFVSYQPKISYHDEEGGGRAQRTLAESFSGKATADC